MRSLSIELSRLLALLLYFIFPMSEAYASRYREVRYAMGTLLEVTFYGEIRSERARELLEGSFEIADRWDRTLSNYKPESAVERFNRSAGKEPVIVDPSLFKVLEAALDLHARTMGAFDLTIRPLMVLWAEAEERGVLPTERALLEARARTGSGLLQLGRGLQVIRRRAGLGIDTGGIGKGVAVDEIVQFLRTAGVTSALVNFGGSSFGAVGRPPDGESWLAAIVFPDAPELPLVRLQDVFLTLSHSMGRGLVIGGKRYGHIIDPASGRAISARRGAAVVTRSAVEGEALTKYLVIRGIQDREVALVLRDVPYLLVEENSSPNSTGDFPFVSTVSSGA